MLDVLKDALDYADRVIAEIPDDRRAAVTPSEEFTVEQLVARLVNGLYWTAGLPRGGSADPNADPDPDLGGASLVAAYRAGAGAMRASWAPGDLDRVFEMPGSTVTGAGLVQFEIIELLGHGWDLAVATGLPSDPGEKLAAAGLEIAQDLGEVLRAPGMMAAAVPLPDGAPAMDRLVAFLGRDPGWGRG